MKLLEHYYNAFWKTQEKAFLLAEAELDDVMFCPVCRKLLTGLHYHTRHVRDYIIKNAAKKIKSGEVACEGA
jgi:hypothetical protein